MMGKSILAWALAAALLGASAAPSWAEGPAVGPVTGLDLPRFVSIKGSEANARRGPGLDHRIDWVFVRKHLPVRVVAEFEHWRRVEDIDGEGGWVHYALLSGRRSGIVSPGTLPLRFSPRTNDHAMATLAPGVIVRIEMCDGTWCKVHANEHLGWLLQSGLWGTRVGEIID